ncbi:hypothetical protein AA0X95_06185 [Bacillus sp. 1P10SD]|uniref:hypothetical protein n=1 Tax=Bacillus sp. 1P10SD TaxID=3132265 RepID=UPI0039A63D49
MNFILGSNDVKGGVFPEKQPFSSSTVAFVYINSLEEMVTIKDGQRLSRSELRYGKFNKVFRIDTTPKTLDYKGEFPSQDPVETFNVQVSLMIQVNDPALVLRNRSQDYSNVIKKQLFYAISDITKKHSISQYNLMSPALEGLSTDIKLAQNLDNIGLKLLDISADVELSAKSKEHLEKLNTLEKEAKYQQKKVQTDIEINSQLSRAKSNATFEEMDRLSELTERYGIYGARLALARNDEERAAIFLEIQEDQKRQQRENTQTVNERLKIGLSIDDIIKLNSLNKPTQTNHTLNPAAANEQQDYTKIEEPTPQKPDDELLSKLSQIITIESEKGE